MRRFSCLAALAMVAATIASTASAATRIDPTGPQVGRILGVVPTSFSPIATSWLNAAYRATNGYGSLRNHGGPTMTTNKSYAIYWQPSNWASQMATGYSSLINQFLGDVAADSGKTSNVYYTATQYSGIKYQSSFGGSVTVTDPLPASGCTDKSTSVCLTDAQLQTEIKSVVSRNGWVANSQTLFFLFTAPGVGSCSGSSCAFTDYCAYHSWSGSGSTALLYANQPYADGVSGCDSGYHPNGGQGDATINVTSHEHNEAITDEQGNAWYDLLGYENGDKCAWSWGTPTGSGASAYNQTINGHHYMLQLEYSNAARGCVQSGL